ncbi:transposase [Methanocaldococcus sp. 10A]
MYIEIIEYLSKVGIRTVIGDASVTTKKFLKRFKELGITYIGRIKKNWKTELFGDTEKIEKLFEKDLENNKFKLRTINGIKFKISEKIVNIPLVGRVKIVAVLIDNQKKPKYLVSTNAKKKSENIIREYLKRPKIEEVHRRYKSVLEIEGNYLTSKKSNIGFVRFIAIIYNCIEYLSNKYNLSFYKVINECSKELIKNGLS